MKKYLYALLAVAATLSFASCDEDFKENGNDSPVIESNAIAFKLEKSNVETRSADASPVISRQMISMGEPIDGMNFYLEETVTRMDDVYYTGPETKGTPVYTENFSTIFGGKFYGVAFAESDSGLAEEAAVSDGAFNDEGGLWKRDVATDPFASNDVLYFYLRGLNSVTGMSNLRYNIYGTGKRSQIDFDYTPPFIASEQQDIVFAARSVTKEEASAPIPILFNHMLTGIKFSIANVNDTKVQTYISQVELPKALHKSAHFRFRSTWENGEWVDDPDTHTSPQAPEGAGVNNGNAVVRVTNGQQLASNESYKLLSTPADITPVDYTSGSFNSKGDYPNSFKQAGNTGNLNDADASMTFWLVPQAVNRDATMVITFHVVSGGKDSGPITRTIKIGELLNGVVWRPGELRTYSLKPELIDVNIEDKVSGFEKTDVVITNTGNIDTFIRAGISANWFGRAGTDYGVAAGYAGEESSAFVPAWKMSYSGGTFSDNYGGSFTGLPGTDWVYNANDGFFYYTLKVPAGENTKTLFTKYAVSGSNIPPEVWYVDAKNIRHQFTNVELVMEIPVQAIDAEDYTSYQAAWQAVGVTF